MPLPMRDGTCDTQAVHRQPTDRLLRMPEAEEAKA